MASKRTSQRSNRVNQFLFMYLLFFQFLFIHISFRVALRMLSPEKVRKDSIHWLMGHPNKKKSKRWNAAGSVDMIQAAYISRCVVII